METKKIKGKVKIRRITMMTVGQYALRHGLVVHSRVFISETNGIVFTRRDITCGKFKEKELLNWLDVCPSSETYDIESN